VDLEAMKSRFYELMDIDPVRGIPTPAALAALDMSAEAQAVA